MTTNNLINRSLEKRGLANEENKYNIIEIAPEYLVQAFESCCKEGNNLNIDS